jgi:lysophospholipase L1-like esterase
MKRSILSALLALLSLRAFPAKAAEPFALKPNDTVVFYGDSITDQRMYTMWTELYVVTRYPKLDVNFVDSGWGGDRVTGGGGGPIDTRLSRDVIAYHPTVMTIMLGMNDGNYANHKEADDTVYYNGYHHIIDSVEKSIPNLRITAIGPSPYDDVTRPFILQPNGYNAILAHYAEYLKRYAQESGFGYADLNTGVVTVLQKANATDPALAQKIIPDRVHPQWAGHLIMAEELLKAWNARPTVSAVAIDAGARKVTASEFTQVTDLQTEGPLKWTQTDEALPLPFANLIAGEKTIDLVIKSSDITEALNAEPLKVTGLAPGKYKLNIDKQEAGTFTDAELATGINLAILDTPMSKQAMAVRDLTVKRLDVHQQRWRTFQVPLTPLDLLHLDEAEKAMDAVELEVTAKQRQAAHPLPHEFELVALN